MIYLEKGINACAIPKHYPVIVNRVVLKNNLTNSEYGFDVADCTANQYFYSFIIEISNMPDGEYIYNLQYGDELIDSGLAVIGDYSNNSTEYKKNNTQKVYERN